MAAMSGGWEAGRQFMALNPGNTQAVRISPLPGEFEPHGGIRCKTVHLLTRLLPLGSIINGLLLESTFLERQR